MCQLVLLGDLDKSISGRGGVGVEVRVQRLRVRGHEEAERTMVTSLLHTAGWGDAQLAPRLEGQ